jgi:hypothetical protein
MSDLKHDAEQVVTDAKGAATALRRHFAARALDWLRRHPRTLVAVVAVLTLIAVTLGLARG